MGIREEAAEIDGSKKNLKSSLLKRLANFFR